MAVDFSRLFRTSSQARYTDERRKGLRLTLGVAIPVALMFSGINYSSGHVWLAAVQVASVILLLVPSLLLSQQDA